MAEVTSGERRDRERHAILVLGMVLFHSQAARGTARAINVSLGGILLESQIPFPPVGAEIELSFSIEEYGLIFSIGGKVARHVATDKPGVHQAGVQFHEESDQLRRVIEKALGVW